MNNLQQKVLEFNKIGGQYCAEEFGLPDGLEDLVSINSQLGFIKEELRETYNALANFDLIEFIDGAGDMLYVILQLFNQVGVDVDVVLEEIHRSNMSKLEGLDPEDYKKNGKIQKGPMYFRPRWNLVLQEAANNYLEYIKYEEESV